MFLRALIWNVRRGRTKGDPNRPRLTDLLSFDLAILCWGMAHFIEAVSNGEKAARITGLNFFGSTHPASVVLDWMSLVCAFFAITMFVFPRLTEKYKKVYLLIATTIMIGLAGIGFVLFCTIHDHYN